MKNEQFHDLDVERLFSARRWALGSAAVLLIVSLIAGAHTLAAYALMILTSVFVVSTLATWFYIYRITQSLHGTGYAIGHVAISVLLTPVFLTGLILMPILVRGDVERLT